MYFQQTRNLSAGMHKLPNKFYYSKEEDIMKKTLLSVLLSASMIAAAGTPATVMAEEERNLIVPSFYTVYTGLRSCIKLS